MRGAAGDAVAMGEPLGRAEFKALVAELEAIEKRRLDDEVRRNEIEQRLLHLIATDLPSAERRQFVRVACEVAVNVSSPHGGRHAGVIVDMGAGGVFVVTSLIADLGDFVELETVAGPGAPQPPLRIWGKVTWSKDTRRAGRAGIGVAFAGFGADPAVHRFFLELFRKRLSDY